MIEDFPPKPPGYNDRREEERAADAQAQAESLKRSNDRLPRVEVIARLVGLNENMTATPREREIAKKLRELGEKLEQEGELPYMRRRHMMRAMMREIEADANAPTPRAQACRRSSSEQA